MKPSFTSRINTFDLLRGWCLIVIVCDHLLRFPSIFDPLTGRGLLWVTAAEGFFFISGMLVGIIRRRKMFEKGLGQATKDVWSRAGTLYVASIVLTLIFTLIGYLLTPAYIEGLKGGLAYFSSPLELAWKTVTLQYTYGWTDFLNYYVVFLLVSPAALWFLRQGRWWFIALLTLGLWVFKGSSWLPLSVDYLTWQAYFFMGLLGGYHFSEIQQWYRSLPAKLTRTGRRLIVGLTTVTLALSFVFTFGTPFFHDNGAALAAPMKLLHLPGPEVFESFFFGVKENPVFNSLFQSNRIGLLRLPLFLLWFTALFLIVRRYEHEVMKRVGWLLLPLGRNSLYGYIMQGVVVFAVPFMFIPQHFIFNSLINVSAVMVIWFAVHKRFLFNIIPR